MLITVSGQYIVDNYEELMDDKFEIFFDESWCIVKGIYPTSFNGRIKKLYFFNTPRCMFIYEDTEGYNIKIRKKRTDPIILVNGKKVS